MTKAQMPKNKTSCNLTKLFSEQPNVDSEFTAKHSTAKRIKKSSLYRSK